ncbi:heterokaryon incompatibility protein-domain-containing protein [Ganoderma leucocontextum]|nr:heterokaryon incompatibility protein-domain-containing protein [Ganoderma leucocontextum]
MWLLDTKTARLHEFQEASAVQYAILSHVWSNREQSFQDIRSLDSGPGTNPHPLVSDKILQCCRTALRDGFNWLWIDTCCIDKTSSAELSEAINSMYAWYAQAGMCYAYLHDVHDDDIIDDPPTSQAFSKSKWFTRGWTLQELAAPTYVVFLTSSWRIIGTRQSLASAIEKVTGIDLDVLLHKCPLGQVSIARRMSWAAKRQTTRVEDRAYSLMGIFGVHMTTIYGEGENAFFRLQEELLKRSPDQTIFAWGQIPYSRWNPFAGDLVLPEIVEDGLGHPPPRGLLASSPAAFLGCAACTSLPHDELASVLNIESLALPEYRLTSYGVRAAVPLIPLKTNDPSQARFLAILACRNERGAFAALLLRHQPHTTKRYFVGTDVYLPHHPDEVLHFRKVFLPLADIVAHASRILVTDIVLQPFDRHPTAGPSARSIALETSKYTGGLSDIVRYAFFLPHRLIESLQAKGFFLRAEDSFARDNDGLMVNALWAWDGSEMVILSFSTRADDDGGRGTGSGRRILFVVGLTCDCPVGGPNPSGPSEGKQMIWFSVRIVTERVRPSHVHAGEQGLRLWKTRLSGLLPSRLSLLGRKAPKRRALPQFAPNSKTLANATASSTPPTPLVVVSDEPTELRPRARHTCSKGRAHLSQEPTSSLTFECASSVVEIDFQHWERCHRSSAAHVYIVNLRLAGDLFDPHGAPSTDPSHSDEKSNHAPSFTVSDDFTDIVSEVDVRH